MKFKNVWALVCAGILAACSSMKEAESLYRQGDRAAALELALNQLDADEPRERQRAARLIGQIGEQEAGDELLAQLEEESNTRVQAEIIRSLGVLRVLAATEPLLQRIPNAAPEVIPALGAAFSQLGPTARDQLVRDYDREPNATVRAQFRNVLVATGPDIADAIIPLFRGKSYFENRDNFAILVELKSPRTAELMLPYLQDAEVADQVEESITRLGRQAVLPTIEAVERQRGTEDVVLLERLLNILGKLGDPRAVEVLMSFSQAPSERVRAAADQALVRIRGF
jgi:HEAT repeat protein